MGKTKIAGLVPWLPWPLCRWRLWTEPVRAERLAALRIGLACFILLDVLTTYGPHVTDFYGPDSLSRVGDRDVFWYVGRPGNYAGRDRDNASWYWSLWRGFNQPMTFGVALSGWIVLTGWIIFRLTERPGPNVESSAWPPEDGRGTAVRWSWIVGGWMAATTVGLLGFWASAATLPDAVTVDLETSLQACSALVAFAAATLFLILHRRASRAASTRRFLEPQSGFDPLLVAAWALTAVFLLVGTWQFAVDFGWIDEELYLDLDWLLTPWVHSHAALTVGVVVLGLSAFLLLVGCCTRLSALLTWLLIMSFDNLNHYNVDSGETVRYILFFYLLLTPCGAVWSVDSWLRRRPGAQPRPVYVAPWPLRLMFVQLIFVYFMNGLYKLSGDTWFEGTSLYYVMSSLEIARFRLSTLPVNFLMLQITSYVVLAFETLFPLLVLFRWTRLPTLILGASFHVGIWLSMEIGFFAPYMLCFYLPMVPWERLSRRSEPGTFPAPRPLPARAEQTAVNPQPLRAAGSSN